MAQVTLPQNLVLAFFWNAVKSELAHPKAVQTVFVHGEGQREVVESERKKIDSLIISVGMKGLEFNGIIVMELVIRAQDKNCQGTGDLPRKWQWWEGEEVSPGM